MAMYDVTQQQDTMMEQYDDNYGGDYVEQYDQGYDGSVQGQAGQDAAAAGNTAVFRYFREYIALIINSIQLSYICVSG